MRKWIKKGVSLPARACSSYIYTTQALSGLGIPHCEDEMHIARAAQAIKFLADTRNPTIRAIALHQLESVVQKRTRIPTTSPVSNEVMAAFLNTPAPSKEGARGDIKSLWSSVRASLQYTSSSIHQYQSEKSFRP